MAGFAVIVIEITLIMSEGQPARGSFLTIFADYICPCFGYKQQRVAMKQQKSDPQHTTDSHQVVSQDQTHFLQLLKNEIVEIKPQPHFLQTLQLQHDKPSQSKIRESPIQLKFKQDESQFKQHSQYKEEDSQAIDYEDVATMQQQYQQFMRQHHFLKQNQKPPKTYSVQRYSENKLLVLGSGQGRLLAKIKKVQINPSNTSVNLQRSAKKHAKEQRSSDATIQKYWEKRYILFQKFDQGIKLDTESWYSVTPQAVAQHIASKISGFDCILDGFAGAGGDSIQLSFTNKQVISNDIDPLKIKLLMNNAAVYGVDNIQSMSQDFFELEFERGFVGAVYMSPPWGGIEYYEAENIKPEEMNPPLAQIVHKALSITENMALLLPANMDVQLLIRDISRSAQQLGLLSTCSLLIQKIYFQERLKFLLVLFGSTLSGVNLGEQLDYLYALLAGGRGHFSHKRVIKKLREDIGMIRLLNLALQCQRITHKQQSHYEIFIQTLLKENLITQQKLEKLNQMDQQDEQYRSKQTSKAEKHKLKHSLPLQITQNHPQPEPKEERPNRNTVISIVNSSGIQRTVSYVSEISESKLAITHVKQSGLKGEADHGQKQLKNSVQIEKWGDL